MKSIDFLCASPASTAICSSTDQRAMVRNDHGMRSMDRRSNHYLSDHHRRRNSKTDIPAIPCSPQLPKNRKSISDYRFIFASQSNRELRRSSAEIINDLTTTPHGSSRHLLSDKTLSEVLQDTDSLSASVPSEPVMTRSLSSKGPVITRSLSSNDSAFVSRNQASRPSGLPISSSNSLVLNSNKQSVASESVRKNESSLLKSSSARLQSRNQVLQYLLVFKE